MVDFAAPRAAGRDAPGGPTGPSRRWVVTAVAGGAVGVGLGGALSACSAGGAGSPDASASAPAELAPDVAGATRALAEIRAVRAAVSETVARFPGRRAQLAPVVEMHRTHEASLVDAVPDRADTSGSAAPYAVPRQRAAALRRLAARERRLHDTLDALAARAESGEFARLLASMGAGVHQRLARWPG